MDKNKVKLSFETYIKEADKIWFTTYDHNGLYCKRSGNKDAVLVGIVPYERRYALRLYASMKKYGNNIFLVPFFANEIAVYNTVSKIFTKLPLKKIDEFGQKKLANENAKFWCSEVYDGFLFLLPHNYPAMVIINMRTLEINYVSNFINELELQSVNNEAYITDVCVENGIAYCSCGCAQIIVKINMKSRNVTICKIPICGNGFNGILKLGTHIWLTPRIKGGVVCYCIKRNTVTLYEKYPDGFTASYVPFHTLYQCEKGIILFPNLSDQFILLNIKTGEMENIKHVSDLISGDKIEDTYGFDNTMAYSIDGKTISFMSGKDYSFYRVNIDTGEFYKTEFYTTNVYPQKRFLSLGNLSLWECDLIGESEPFDSCMFIEYIKERHRLRNDEDKFLGAEGKEIYAKLVGI